MLHVIPHGDVTELRFSSVRSRLIRYAVSAFVTRDVLIDTGFPVVQRELARWCAASRPQGAIVTHSHEDHGGNVPWLVGAGVPIQMAPETEAVIRAPGRIGWYRRICWGAPTPLRATPTPFTHAALALRPARGHSSDHHVVWDAERETVFGGDLFVGVKVRLAHLDEDLRAQVQALREVAAWRPARFFDGHRGRVEDPAARLSAKADWIEATIAAIERRIREGWEDAAIRDAVLGREELTGWMSVGDYSRLNFVRSVRRSMA